jgi:hypothetical protein
MGSALVSRLDGNEHPSVGLLNIGEEAIKGSEVIKRAGELLRAAGAAGQINFHGNVEGNDIFKGTTDLVVCDGFVGNVALKTAEGLASHALADDPRRVHPHAVLTSWRHWSRCRCSSGSRRVDHRRYSGGALLGLRGLVFKSHGSSDAFAFEQALNRAYDAARNRLLDRVHDRIRATRLRLHAARTSPPPPTPHDEPIRPRPRATPASPAPAACPAAAPGDQRRPGGRTGPSRHRDIRRLDRRAHRHPRPPLSPSRRRTRQRPGRRGRSPGPRSAGCGPPRVST